MKLQDNNALESKKFYLDWSKWRCGGGQDGPNKLGEGPTKLLNRQGYQCCLGQCEEQVGLQRHEIIDHFYPWATGKENMFAYKDKHNQLYLTVISVRAATINDDSETTPEQKITLLQELFAKEGYTIEVINKPE